MGLGKDASGQGRCEVSGSQRRKGAAGERELCHELARYFGTLPKRTLDQARDGGYDVPLGALRIEVKRRKELKGLYGWMAQVVATLTARGGHIPMVAIRADNEEWLVTVRLKDLIPFAAEVMRLNAASVEALL